MRGRPIFKISFNTRLAHLPIPDSRKEIRLFTVVRNEILRLPYFFKYYRKLGVDRFFVVDNGSTDGTLQFLSKQKNTHIFQTRQNFGKYKQAWILTLLDKYGAGNWCLVVDADEIFYYPYCEYISVKELCQYLDKRNFKAMFSFLVDMYSKKPIYLAHYRRGKDFLESTRYFDSYVSHGFEGGMRKRVFKTNSSLRKFILFKYRRGLLLILGCHLLQGAKFPTDINGCVLHFKYFSDFIARAYKEVKRGKYWRGALEYKVWAEKLRQNPKLSLYYSKSKKFRNSKQLIKLGLMRTPKQFISAFKNKIPNNH